MDHLGHDYDHDHGAGHDHANEEFVEALLSVGICAAFGVVAVLLATSGLKAPERMPGQLLATKFWYWVFGGGVVLLAITAIRGIVLWKAAGHVHGEHCDHSHDDHQHGGAAWRTIVLIFPLLLFFLGLPNDGFSDEYRLRQVGDVGTVDVGSMENAEGREAGTATTFADIANALRRPELMDAMDGLKVTLRGQFKPSNDRQFTLFTNKMTCCVSDTVTLKAKIVVKSGSRGGSLETLKLTPMDWVQVQGVLTFKKASVNGEEQILPVVMAKLEDITKATPE